MQWDEFSDWGAKISQWAADYHTNLRDRPVRAQSAPGEVAALIAPAPPEGPQDMGEIMEDFERVVMPGITHWQHPRFFAYFPANAAPPSMLAEMLVSTIAAQCMLWQTSPAATEMETVMLDWLRQAIGLPKHFSGVIQDSASSATLAAVLTMRERALNWEGNKSGLSGAARLRIYCSSEVHTSVDRAIWVAGIGQDNLVRIPISGGLRGLRPEVLRKSIMYDITMGYRPAGIIACTGGTGTGACDDIAEVVKIAKEFDLYTHIDAAWAGAAMICPEFRTLWAGAEGVDSIVFNPHKWLGAQFDCSAHFLADPLSSVKTLAIKPEYLKTHGINGLINYSEWSVPLGRRFRALKLWFLLRSYGLEALRTRLRNHVAWAEELAEKLRGNGRFKIVTEPTLSLFTFRVVGIDDQAQIDFVNRVNDDGRMYITQTEVDGAIAIRFQIGQFDVTKADIDFAFNVMCEIAG